MDEDTFQRFVDEQLEALQSDVSKGRVSFPATCSASQRRRIHEKATKLGMLSQSVGEGSHRHITVYMPGADDAPDIEQVVPPTQKMPRQEALSRKLTALLRHRALEEGLHITEEGYVRLADILELEHMASVGYTVAEVEALVERQDEKRRFGFTRWDGELWVRANQGHTMRVVQDDKLLKPVTAPEEIDCCVHGTYLNAWQQIVASGGISRMQRNHVHFAPRLPGSEEVISGMRPDCEVGVFVSATSAMAAGILFFRSANGVILTAGNTKGMVPLEHIEKAIRLQDGTILWKQDEAAANSVSFAEPDVARSAAAAWLSPDCQAGELAKQCGNDSSPAAQWLMQPPRVLQRLVSSNSGDAESSEDEEVLFCGLEAPVLSPT